MAKRKGRIAGAALAVLLTGSPGFADDIWEGLGTGDGTCDTNVELTHGARQAHDLQAFMGIVADVDWARVQQRAQRSYEVRVTNSAIRLSETAPSVRLLCNGTVLTAGAPYENVARDAVSIRWLSTTNDDTFVRTTAGLQGPNARYEIQLLETTYAVPRYNNSATQQTVLMVQNTRATAVNGSIYFYSGGGGAPIHTQALALPARGLLVLNTATLAPLAGQSGSAQIAHDGGYGALSGKAVALEPATGFTFDTPLVPKPY